MSRILAIKRRFCLIANGGRISVRFSPARITTGSLFQFYGFTELLKRNFPNNHFRRVAFRTKRRFFASANDGRISVRFSHATITRGPDFPIFRRYGTFWKLIFLIITSDESHFGQKRQFCASANGGRISARFSPAAITMWFRFSNFTALWHFPKTNFPNLHFR